MRLTKQLLAVVTAVIGVGSLLLMTGTAAAATTPCAANARVDTASAGDKLFVLCSTNPGMSRMDKELWVSSDGGQSYRDMGPAPRKGITQTFAAASETTVGYGTAAADQCTVEMSFDGGGSWQETLAVTDGAPASGLRFSDASNGTVVCGYGDSITAYRTTDGGHSWVAT